MSILQIGRVFDTYDVDAATVTRSGPVITIEGDVQVPSSVPLANRNAVAAAIRERLVRLPGGDEEHVPVIWSEDPSVNGWYRPLSASAVIDVATLNEGYLHWTAELEQAAGGGGLPQVEVLGSYVAVPNGLGASGAVLNTAAQILIASIPSSASDAWNGYTVADGTARTAESGALASFDFTPSAGAALPLTLTSRFTIDPANAYVGACSIRGTYAGVTGQLCGGQMSVPPNGLVLSNGLVRAKITAGVLTVEVYDSGAWVATSAAGFTLTATATLGAIFDWDIAPLVQVIRNTPERCTVRVIGAPSVTTSAVGRFWCDLTVVRGSRMISCQAQCDKAATWDLRAVGVASTSITGGMRQTSNDVNGNRLLVVGTGNGTAAATDLGVTDSVAKTTFGFGIGVELNGSGSTGNDQAQKVAYEFFTGRSETQRVVRR